MKNRWKVLICILLVTHAAGCASVQRKFTRKPKESKHVTSVIPLDRGPYQKKFSNEFYYNSHFTLWKTWQSEIIDALGENRKKVTRAGQEALGNLKDLKAYLLPEKQAQLDGLIDDLSKVTARTDPGSYSASDVGPLRTELERIRRVVAANFYYEKIKDDMIPENVDLGGAS